MRKYRTEVERKVARYGRAIQYVESAVDERGISPAFAYTVGLTAIDQPELIMTGRDAELSALVLNQLSGQVLDGAVLQAGDRWSVGRLDVYLVDVHGCCVDWLAMAQRIYGRGRVRAMQTVWADGQGQLPWEGSECSMIVQPVLGPPPGAALTG
ncbi:DUF4262 domain-containing protein [Rhodococcus sp. D2-41]|uniref:DUF4262 domain-containing protein n=1 Tax=Speluncibacter jeojiensis TaxID=2710754 RepID=UPI00240E9D2D|nr:DUF4262 domain-containing protein [Rhodococcus sp. D2-41]MDG3010745.1 DUF4262 domain-containing protein [Rhodococcus sp. D2-41]